MKNAILSLLISFFVAVMLAPIIIKLIRKLKGGQPILGYVETHKNKEGTPTMGGLIFILGIVVAFFCFMNENVKLASIALGTMLGYGLLGFLDDFIKVKLKHNLGLKAYQKVIGQFGIAILVAVFVYLSPLVGTTIIVPFTNGLEINLAWGIIPFVVFVLIAITNSVNLTDGLDGLAGGVSLAYLFGFFVVLYLYITKQEYMGSNLMQINELYSILNLVGASIGGVIAFLCFNTYPAQVFMGDTGSLALGGLIGATCVLTKFELLLPMLGMMFVISAVSVILQVLYFKKTKKRIFLMAPLHHHFEKKGTHETKIVAIYIIITALLAVSAIYFSL